MAKDWIKDAIKHPGALTKKAKASGKSVSAYCKGGKLTTKTTRQCNLAKTLRGFSK